MINSETAFRRRADDIFRALLESVWRATSRLFAALMPAQWLFAILLAEWFSPRDLAGSEGAPHIHRLAAVVLGGALTSLPVYLARTRPDETLTRHVVAAGQMLMSALLIHLTGGRIETHFHVFGSLAILAFYRDWAVLLTAGLVAVADYGARGLLAPQTVYGVAQLQPVRFLEHAGWVLFEILPLIYLIRQGRDEVRVIADRQAKREQISQDFEAKVLERTAELQEANRRAVADREAAQENELLRERQRLHNQFLANVSHDLRTPITAIKGFAETLLDGGLDDTKRRLGFIRTIEKNAERLRVLVENLLDLTMLDGMKVQPLPAEIPLPGCLDELADDFGPQARRKFVSILVSAPVPLTARADAGHVWQVMQNLLSNAIKFSPRGGTISVAARLEGGRIEISVSDQGPGVPRNELELVFKRFQTDSRGDRTREGSGLGLAISKSLAELNGGVLTAHCTEGKGALFTLTLPAATPQPPSAPYN